MKRYRQNHIVCVYYTLGDCCERRPATWLLIIYVRALYCRSESARPTASRRRQRVRMSYYIRVRFLNAFEAPPRSNVSSDLLIGNDARRLKRQRPRDFF